MKICLKCNKLLPSKDYYVHCARYDGLDNYCRRCYGCQYKHHLKFNFKIIDKICKNFDNITYLCSIVLEPKYTLNKISSDKLIYLCVSGTKNIILKVGQTTSWKRRVTDYNIPEHFPVVLYFFDTPSWKAQDELEAQVRLFLEDLGHVMPWDNTGERLKRIQI